MAINKERIQLANYPVADNLKRIITEKALNASEISRRAGLKARTATDITTGLRVAKASEIKSLAKAIGIEVGELFK